MGKKRDQKTKVSNVELGPIRHAALSDVLIARIKNIATVFAEVNERPVRKWIEDFQRDENPEKEVAVWEAMAAAYSIFTKDRKLSAGMRGEAFQLLLLRSMKDEPAVLEEARHLPRSEAAALLALFQNVASADGWGFGSSPGVPPDSGSPPANPVKVSQPINNYDDFTVRDEANALTAFAFRNGFIEELHAGRRSPLLDQPEYSRITDDEMRRLMIEASQKLAEMLALKRSDPKKYISWLAHYHQMYCQKWKRD